jgi:cytoskeletal protein CcmA (bactofilin family)
MFSEKKNTQSTQGERNIISITTNIVGDIKSEGDFRIDGKVEGNVETSGRLILGKDGFIKGTIICSNGDIEGKISGTLTCSGTLNLKKSAFIEGEVFLDKLAVEPGATFNATCNMKGVKALNNDDSQTKREKSVS